MDILSYNSAIIITLFASVICLFYRHKYSYWKRRGISYMEPTIILGNISLLDRRSLSEFPRDLYEHFKKKSKDFGGFYFLHKPYFIPTNPKLIKTILVEDFSVFHDRGLDIENNCLLLANIVTLKGDRWKQSRKNLSPIFTLGKLKLMVDILVKCSSNLDDVIDKSLETQRAVDIKDISIKFTSDCIANCTFGVQSNSLKNPDEEFKNHADIVAQSFSNPILFILASIYSNVFDFFNIKMLSPELESFFVKCVQRLMDDRKTNNSLKNNFISHYINNIKRSIDELSANDVVVAASTIYMGGLETTWTALTFSMFELAINKSVQERARGEILEMLDQSGGEITYRVLADMNYMDKVISETLRKYPTIALITRECNDKYTLPGSDVTIDQGVRCIISVLGLHMDPEIYPDPDKFEPERFSEEEVAKRHPYSYLPFGKGPRICIGQRFAFLVLKIALIRLLKNYKFSLDPRTSLPIEFDKKSMLLLPKSDIWLQCRKINSN